MPLFAVLSNPALILWIFTWQQRKSAAAAAAGAAASRYVHASETITASSSSADTADLELRLALLERRLALLGNNEVSDAPLSLTGSTTAGEEEDGNGTLVEDAAYDERERHFNALFDFLEVIQSLCIDRADAGLSLSIVIFRPARRPRFSARPTLARVPPAASMLERKKTHPLQRPCAGPSRTRQPRRLSCSAIRRR
jgi:hypothetical protein